MKLPAFAARFVNWVEGEECCPVSEKKPRRARKHPVQKHRTHSVDAAKEMRVAHKLYCFDAVLICLTVAAMLLVTVSYLPPFGSAANPEENEVYERYVGAGLEEAGAVNTVAGMILDYRAFDTLGESNVLFIAVCSVLVLLRADRNREGKLNIPELETKQEPLSYDPILRGAVSVLMPVLMVFGICVILNGHLSAGGGFSGGAILGGAVILYMNAYGPEKIDAFFTFRAYRRITFVCLITYTLLKSYSFYTGANGLESGIPLGKPGAILSSGLILPLNICVGLVVACTMVAFYSLFTKGGFGDGK